MSEEMNQAMCDKCMEESGHELASHGVHTVRLSECPGCKQELYILPLRHWRKRGEHE